MPAMETPNTSGSRFFSPIITRACESLVIGWTGLNAAELTRPMILETSDGSAQIAWPYCSIVAVPRRCNWSTFIGATRVVGRSETVPAGANKTSRGCWERWGKGGEVLVPGLEISANEIACIY